MHEVLVNRLGGLSLPRKSVVRLTDRPDMTLDVYRGRKATMLLNQWMEINYADLYGSWLCNYDKPKTWWCIGDLDPIFKVTDSECTEVLT